MVPLQEHQLHSDDPYLGAVLEGRYRLIGVMLSLPGGAVYRAVEDPIGQEVAIRVFAHGSMDPSEESRFLAEAQRLVQLRNPGVVSLLAYGTGQGIHWAAYEMIRAEPLSEGLARGPLGWSQALGLVLHMLAGLDAAHRMGILHGALVPSDILIIQDKAGLRARLAGLGSTRLFGYDPLAEVKAGGDPESVPRELIDYMSPDRGGDVGPWSDLYSLGAILYHMLTGSPPYVGSPAEVVRGHMGGQVPAPSPAYPCPQEVLDLVVKALHKVPAQRFTDARGMYGAISAILANPSPKLVQPGHRGSPAARSPSAESPKQVDPYGVTGTLSAVGHPSSEQDAGSTMDIDLDDLQELAEDTGRAGIPGPGDTQDIDVEELDDDELMELEVDDEPMSRGGAVLSGPSAAVGPAVVDTSPGVDAGPSVVSSGPSSVVSSGPSVVPSGPAAGLGQATGGPVQASPVVQEAKPSPLVPAPDAGKEPEKATLLVDVNAMELARLHQEFEKGRPAAEDGEPKGAALPMPALIGVGALGIAVLVLVVVGGLKLFGGMVQSDAPADAGISKRIGALAELAGVGDAGEVDAAEPDEAIAEAPKSDAELKAEARASVKDVRATLQKVRRELDNEIRSARRIVMRLPPKARPRANPLAHELLSLSRALRRVRWDVTNLDKALRRRPTRERLQGILANAVNIKASLMRIQGDAQGTYDELREMAAAASRPAQPRPEVVAAAPPPRPREPSPPIRVAQAQRARVSQTPREPRPDEPSARPTPTRQSGDPELTALLASVERKPAAATPAWPKPKPVVHEEPEEEPEVQEEPTVASAHTFEPVVSTPPPDTKTSSQADTEDSQESDEELLLRILGSPREGPIVVAGEACPCDPRHVEAAAKGGKALTQCELRACEKVPPGTPKFADINLNLASYFFKRRNLRREFAALYRATSYGKYRHDPQVLAAYIKVAVKLRRFRVALQAKDRFLFVQEKLPPSVRRRKVAEVYKVLAQAFEHQFYRHRERNPKSSDFSYLNRAIDFWERYADYSGDRRKAERTIAELKRLRKELEEEL